MGHIFITSLNFMKRNLMGWIEADQRIDFTANAKKHPKRRHVM